MAGTRALLPEQSEHDKKDRDTAQVIHGTVKKEELFYNANGEKKRICDLESPDHGCFGAGWWFELDYPYETELSDLRAFVMRFLDQKAQESAAERHYSLEGNIQSNNC